MTSKNDTTIVICCAGMGTRLGIGTTKSLLDIKGKPLIIRQLELLKEYDDIRIVVGYQADKVIKTVTEYRKDILFAFNYDYKTSGTLQSLNKGIAHAREYTVVMGGDFLIEKSDFKQFMRNKEECIAYTTNISSEPVFIELDNNRVSHFSKMKGEFEWSGLAKIKTNHISNNHRFVYEMIEELLPIKAMEIQSIDIDTTDDYEKAVDWINKNNNYNERENEKNINVWSV